jgi:ribonuclease HIII
METPKLTEYYTNLAKLAEPKGYNIGAYREIDYGIQFTISTKLESGLLRVFQNKKGILKIDPSQIKSEEILTFISAANSSLLGGPQNPLLQKADALPMEFDFKYPVIGTDESGKGDYFGPLVIAGTLVDQESETRLTAAGVRDSKQISDSSIVIIANEIRRILPKQNYSIVSIGPEKYNELYATIKNLNRLLAWGHARAIENILANNECANAIADQFGDESFIQKALLERGKKIRLIQRPKAEQFIAVAAASVLAREGFLNRLSDLGKTLGIELLKGASPQVEDMARQIIKTNGFDALSKYAKIHFKTTDRLR